MAATAESTPAGLSGLDWLVIVAATVSLVVLAVWLFQGQPGGSFSRWVATPPTRTDPTESTDKGS